MFESPVITLNFIVDRLLKGEGRKLPGADRMAKAKRKNKITGDGLDTVHEIHCIREWYMITRTIPMTLNIFFLSNPNVPQ
jgi:hypothetical protein